MKVAFITLPDGAKIRADCIKLIEVVEKKHAFIGTIITVDIHYVLGATANVRSFVCETSKDAAETRDNLAGYCEWSHKEK